MLNQTTIPVYAFLALLILSCGAPSEPETQDPEQVGAPVVFEPNGEIRISRDGETVGMLPAEYVPLDYPDMPWRGDPAIGMSDAGIIYVALYARIFSSQDGGRTWKSRTLDVGSLEPPMKASTNNAPSWANYDSFGVLRDGTLLWGYRASELDTNFLIRSSDGGESWQPWSFLDKLAPFTRAGGNQNCLVELRDGTLLWPTILAAQQAYAQDGSAPPPTTYVFRSSDGGKTWGEKHALQEWGTETNLVELQSGALLAAIRYQRAAESPAPASEPEYLRKDWEQRQMQKGTVGKRVFISDSEDGGRTWKGFRAIWREPGGEMDLGFGQAHGHLVQLLDKTVVLVVEDRYPYPEGDVSARISRDGGQTWLPEIYHLSTGHGYGASVVLADDTIVTALGNAPLDERGRPLKGFTAQVVRWRLK